MKKCSKCKNKYPATLEYFKPDKSVKDGFGSWCRNCKQEIDRVYSRKYRLEHPEHTKAQNKKWRPEQGELIKKYWREHPDRYRCMIIFHCALIKGIIERQPCVVCGDPKSHGHHPDHSKPLEVIWLCPLHHKWVEFNLMAVPA